MTPLIRAPTIHKETYADTGPNEIIGMSRFSGLVSLLAALLLMMRSPTTLAAIRPNVFPVAAAKYA